MQRHIVKCPCFVSKKQNQKFSDLSDTWNFFKKYINFYKQLDGTTMPDAVPAALVQDASAGWFLYVSFTFSNFIPLHGFSLLQSNFTAISVADVPWISWYVTSLIFTPEIYATTTNYRNPYESYPDVKIS